MIKKLYGSIVGIWVGGIALFLWSVPLNGQPVPRFHEPTHLGTIAQSVPSGRFLQGFSQQNIVNLPDSSPVRVQFMDLITGPLSDLNTGLNQVIHHPFLPQRVRLRIEIDRDRGFTYVIFENEVLPSSITSGEVPAGPFPLVSPGNMVIRRTHQGGAIDQIRFFLGQGPHVFLRFFPHGSNQTRASFFAYNDQVPLIDDMVLPFPISRILSLPVQEMIVVLSGNRQWSRFLHPTSVYDYELIEAMVHQLRPLLSTLPDRDDGAMDQFGRFVTINTLEPSTLPGFNCSGFAKWVADGVYIAYSQNNLYMEIEPLKEKHLDLRGSAIGLEFEELRDPYFGLDWTRNIARTLAQIRSGIPHDPEDMDVRQVPFFQYTEDVGFSVRDLWQIMYLLAITEPGHFYLGSINGEFGANPMLWQHYHVVVLFPYFDQQGVFRVAVMERNVETGVNSLIRRYAHHYIHLVSVRAPQQGMFLPPLVQTP